MTKRLTKQQRLDEEGRNRAISALNDFFSELNTIGMDTGYQIPDEHDSALVALHRELVDQREK